MILLRRLVHIVAWAGTLVVMFVALAFIVSQTPWFRDWARRTIVREARQYLNGELTIGRLSGNLFFGASLSDVAIDMSGDRVVAVKTLQIDYSIIQLVSKGLLIDSIVLTAPEIHLSRDAQGWNVGRLIKRQEREADRHGPRRPISLPSIVITNGIVVINDAVGSAAYKLPHRIDDLDVNAGFEYAPVHYSIDLRQLNFKATAPELQLSRLAGGIAVRDDNWYVEEMVLQTGESSLGIDGVIEQYLSTREIKLRTNGRLSLPEVGRFVTAASGYALHPAVDLTANGTTDRLRLDLNVTSEAGLVRGQIVTDLRAPDFSVAGPVYVERLNLAPILKMPAQRSDITGDLRFALAIPSRPADVPVLERMEGTFKFSGPQVTALGYQAANAQAAGSFNGRRINLASANVNAYGGSATTKGMIELPKAGGRVAFDLLGSADNVDVRRLPASTRAPKLESSLAVAEYHVRGVGASVNGSATLHESLVEGATIAAGAVVEFDTSGPLSYAARGAVANLDVRRIGRALELSALDKPIYEGRVGGTFDVNATGTALAEMNLSASGTLTDSSIVGAHFKSVGFKTDLSGGALAVYAKGDFAQLNPGFLTERKSLDGNLSGNVDGTFRIRDLTAPVTMPTIGVDGHVTLGPSLLGGVQISAADVEGRYDAEVADIKHLQVKGPDVVLDASGRLALDRTSESNLKYHVDATSLSEVGRIAGQKSLAGSLVLDGTVTGNGSSLATMGKLNASGLAWNDTKALDLNSTYNVTVPNLDFVNARVEATTDATFVEVAGLRLNELTAKTTYAQTQLEFSTKMQERTRELDATGRIIFHPDHGEIHLPQLALRTEGIEWRNVAGTEAAIQFDRKEVRVKDLRLASGDQTLEVGGAFVLSGDEPSGAVKVRAGNVDLSQLERLLLQNRGLAGRLTADATISGTRNRPILDGHVEVRNGAFQAFKYESLVADVDYESNRIKLDSTLQQGPGVTITAKGTLPTTLFSGPVGSHVAATAEDAIDLRVQTSSISLGLIQGFTTVVTNVVGTVAADVHVTGSGRDPHFQGYIELRDGAFGVPAVGTNFSGLDTRIDLESDMVRIRRFEILDENGEQLAVAGQIGVHEGQVGAVDITLESTNFEVIDNEFADVQLATNLKVTGDLLLPRVQGDIRVAAGRLELDRVLQLFWDPYSVEELPDVVSAERATDAAGGAREATQQALARAGQRVGEGAQEQAAETAPKPTGYVDRLALDVHLRIPDNLVLRGRRLRPGGPTRASIGDVNITVGGDLTIRKDPQQPISIIGTATTVRGTYTFQGRQFDLLRDGTLRFTGDLNPIVDVTARRHKPDTGVEARVRIRGTVQTPELQLSSTPPLDESDILALIVFNRPINELGTGERASLAATAGGIATGFLAQPLGASIGRALDLDIFEISPAAEGDTLGGEIIVGDQIGDRTFVKLRQQFGERAYTEFLLEYRLTDFMRLRASGAPEASNAANRIGQRRIERAGIDLIFFFSY